MFRNSLFLSGKGGKEKSSKGGGDPDYEEIEIRPQRNNKEIMPEHRKENVPHCDLCGSTNAAVRCDKCNNQAFCHVCDETYHGHPKRASHARMTLTEVTTTVRPPIPPKGSEGQVVSPPQPPPRKNKKGGILSSSFGRGSQEEESGRSFMGSLKKIMGNRPLPPPPESVLADKRRGSAPDTKNNVTHSNPALNAESFGSSMTVAIPQSIMELNSKAVIGKPPSSMPPTSSAAVPPQYPRTHHKGQAPMPGRKLSLQQFPTTFDERRASMADTTPFATNSWDKQPPVDIQKRSQSVSDEQWNQMLAIQGANPPKGYPGSAATSEVGGISPARRGYNTMGGNTRGMGRGMVSSSSVCDLNSLAQQQHPTAPQMAQQPHGYPNMQSANSFQQLSLVGYDPNMMWMQAPTPCALCQPSHMYPSSVGSGPMKRAASNISMNLTSMGSDVSGYPWAGGAHVHHHMPMGYPGYYPGCHQHMVPPGYGQGSAMSIPDSMRSFNRMPHSPAPSGRSSSHRSHKSSKSRSFGAADTGGRKSRNHSRKRSEESESESSSITNDDNLPAPSPKPGKPGGLAWQCDHCTFINPGHAQACGMCSKVPGKVNGRTSRRGNEHRKGDKRRDSRIDSTDNIRDTSDYDNHHRRDNRREGRLKSSGSIKSSSGKGRKKSYRRGSSSRSLSPSGSEAEEEGIHLERQLRNLRLSSRSRAGDYDGLSVTSRPREKERGSLKKEGKHGYKRRV